MDMTEPSIWYLSEAKVQFDQVEHTRLSTLKL